MINWLSLKDRKPEHQEKLTSKKYLFYDNKTGYFGIYQFMDDPSIGRIALFSYKQEQEIDYADWTHWIEMNEPNEESNEPE